MIDHRIFHFKDLLNIFCKLLERLMCKLKSNNKDPRVYISLHYITLHLQYIILHYIFHNLFFLTGYGLPCPYQKQVKFECISTM